MSLDAEKMLGCDNREVTGWFDDKKTGWYGVHYRINEPKKIVIKLRKEIEQEMMMLNEAELKKFKKKQKEKKTQTLFDL